MEMRTLGGTGMQVSSLCLGAMMLGKIGNSDHDECVRIIHRGLDAGINFIDTADGYSKGESEEIVGKAIKGRRDNLIIATKFFASMGDDVNMKGGSRRWITRAVEDSLRRLGTDYIDLYQYHRIDESVELEEVMFTLTELVRQGKIRQFGSSAFPADKIVESHWTAEKMGLHRFRSEQCGYSIMARHAERFVFPAARRYGMGVITYSPLDGGYLAGKYRKPEDLQGDNRITWFSGLAGKKFDPYADAIQRKLAVVNGVAEIADDIGVPIAQLSMAWVLKNPAVTSALIGPRTIEQITGLLPCVDVKLSDETLDRIDKLVPPGVSLNPVNDMPNGLTNDQLRR